MTKAGIGLQLEKAFKTSTSAQNLSKFEQALLLIFN